MEFDNTILIFYGKKKKLLLIPSQTKTQVSPMVKTIISYFFSTELKYSSLHTVKSTIARILEVLTASKFLQHNPKPEDIFD